MKGINKPIITVIIAASLVTVGVVAVFFGSRYVFGVYQLVHSPLDREAAVVGGVGESIAQVQILETGGNDFLPLYTIPEDQVLLTAPELPGLAAEKPLSGPAGQVQEPIPQLIPERLVIEKISVNALILPVKEREVEYLGSTYRQWRAPLSNELGWHNTSALIGEQGNTVINGHSNGVDDTFEDLADLKNGDIIEVYAEDYRFSYAVANVMILKERWEPIETRMQNALWINPSLDERLTLISCWPSNSSTHRLIVVAAPLEVEKVGQLTAQDD